MSQQPCPDTVWNGSEWVSTQPQPEPTSKGEPECERLTGHDWSMNADGSFTCVRCGLFRAKASQQQALSEQVESEFNEFAEFVTVHNKGRAVPWPIAELFVREMRKAILAAKT